MENAASSTREETTMNGDSDDPPPTNSNDTTTMEEESSRVDKATEFTVRPDTNHTNTSYTNNNNNKQLMRQQAQDVLDTMGGSLVLDRFHLWGVVADPRISTTTTPTTSYHGRYNTTTTANNNNNAPESNHNTTTSSSTYSSYYTSLESTFSGLSENMESLSTVLEDWSKYMVSDGDHGTAQQQDQERHLQLLQELLPEHLKTIDTSSILFYLQHSQSTATAFGEIVRTHQKNGKERSAVVLSNPQATDNIPPEFFTETFDLTHPGTFERFLLETDHTNDNTTTTTTTTTLQLQSLDTLNNHLDSIELELLTQVRQNSEQFFYQSQRFVYLQKLMEELLMDIFNLQSLLATLTTHLVRPSVHIPQWDKFRSDLQILDIVLERVEALLSCKHSLSGVLVAQDDVTAVQHIRYGRQLLLYGSVVGREEENTNDTSAAADNDHGDNDIIASSSTTLELVKLTCLQSIAEQLDSYELLVNTRLRDELVEVFLSWDTTTAANNTSNNTTTGGVSEETASRLQTIVDSLSYTNSLKAFRTTYHTRLQERIRMTMRTTVSEFALDHGNTNSIMSVSVGASSMSLTRFMDCLDLLFEQLLNLIAAILQVNGFLVASNISLHDQNEDNVPTTPLQAIVVSACELSSKSISELLRLRKEAHSLVNFDEMKSIWDACMGFVNAIEERSGGSHTSVLKSTLLAQVKAFVERRHESNMSSLAAALDSERWVQCEVSHERQEAVSRLCTGRSHSVVFKNANSEAVQKRPDIEVEGIHYKVVWSCLLLLEMVLGNIATATQFSSMSASCVSKISELLRLFNSRTTQLVLGAGAIHSHAKLKSINAKHLSLVTQCVGLVLAILPQIRAAMMAQLPKKQHALLTNLDQIRKEYETHSEKVLNKFVSIIGALVERDLTRKIPGTDFDARANLPSDEGIIKCCAFLDGVAGNTRKMHQVIKSLLPPEHLVDTFSRIFAFLDTKIPGLLIGAANIQPVFSKQDSNSSPKASPKGPSFFLPKTDEGKRRMLLEVEAMTQSLNALEGVRPWDFTLTKALGRQLDYSLSGNASSDVATDDEPEMNAEASGVDVSKGSNNAAEPSTGDDDEPDTISKDETRSDAPTPEPAEPPFETENEISASLAKPESNEASPAEAVEATTES